MYRNLSNSKTQLLWFLVILTSCQTTFQTQTKIREQELERVISAFPILSQDAKLQTKTDVARSRVVECGKIYVVELYGTNSHSLEEVFKWYEVNIDTTFWKHEFSNESSSIYSHQDRIYVSISNRYRFHRDLQGNIENAKGEFQTIYIVNFNAFIYETSTTYSCS